MPAGTLIWPKEWGTCGRLRINSVCHLASGKKFTIAAWRKEKGLGGYDLNSIEVIGELKQLPHFKLPPLSGETSLAVRCNLFSAI
jgi:hypothetical protein